MAAITPSARLYGQDASITTQWSGTLIPTLWSTKVLKAYYERQLLTDISNSDYEGEIKSKGDTVRIRKAPKVTTFDYKLGGGFVDSNPDFELVDLKIDHAKGYSIPVYRVDEVQSDLDLVTQFTDAAGEQLKDDIQNSVITGTAAAPGFFGKADVANIGANAGFVTGGLALGTAAAPLALGTVNILEIILRMAAVLDQQKVPDSDRWLLIDSATRLRLLNSELRQAYLTGDATSPIRNGLLGVLDRFTIYNTNVLPIAQAGKNYWGGAVSGAPAHRVIIAGHKSALTFATQLTQTEVKDMPNDFGKRLVGLAVYGFEVLRPEALTYACVSG
jgi:hypothetical protein